MLPSLPTKHYHLNECFQECLWSAMHRMDYFRLGKIMMPHRNLFQLFQTMAKNNEILSFKSISSHWMLSSMRKTETRGNCEVSPQEICGRMGHIQ